MKIICRDLFEEYTELDALVEGLSPQTWRKETPFFCWTIKDQISHLAYFDRMAHLAATDSEGFRRHLDDIMKNWMSYDDLQNKINALGCAMADGELLDTWRKDRAALLRVFESLEPGKRLPWYGPTMSARSSATARLMETWAHGQDVVDSLGLVREPTDRLKHIAHLGFSTLSWSFINRGVDAPSVSVRLELESPSGQIWTWGDSDAEECVAGLALDFCLVVTQRRHVRDTTLVMDGETAVQWMLNAQVFAGPPENGPEPGERVVK